MQTVRRLYMYLMSGITLGVLLVGMNMLFTVVFHALGISRGIFAGGSSNDREQLSLAIALIVVGLLVWTVHWLFVERSLRPENPTHDEERASGARAFYLTIVLAGALLFGVLAGIQVLQQVARSILGVTANDEFGFGGSDVGATLATVLVTGLAWTYHAAIRRRDLASGPLEGAGAWIPRVYLYGAALLGLVMLAISIGSLLTTGLQAMVGDVPDFGDVDFTRRTTADAIAGIVGWGVVFLGHWWYATSLIHDTRWRGVSERRARLRLAYFVAGIAASAIGVVVFAFQALNAGIGMALGVSDVVNGDAMVLAVGGPILALLPWAGAWLLHWRWMRAESMEADGPGWIATVDRLDAGVVALVGLVAASVGVGGLMGLLIDVLLGGNRADAEFWRREAAGYLAIAFPGAVMWLWNWARLEGRHSAAPDAEAGSTVRRAYLLIIVAAALIVSLASLAYLLYRLFGAILQVELSDNAVSAISAPLGALLVAAALAIYHGVAVRRDQALRGAASAAAPEIALAADVTAPPARRVLVLSGPPGADLETTVAALRAALAPELKLEDGIAAD
jgi:Domain of unknown function (DUF5671)